MIHTKDIRNKIEWGLRIILAVVFISRAIPAFMGEQEWIGLFTNVGIASDLARMLLILIGISDTLIAILLLVKPIRAIIVWAIIWPIVPAIGTYLSGSSLEFVLIHYGSLVVATVFLLYLRGFPRNVGQLLSV